jgi:hypothetical protein
MLDSSLIYCGFYDFTIKVSPGIDSVLYCIGNSSFLLYFAVSISSIGFGELSIKEYRSCVGDTLDSDSYEKRAHGTRELSS